MEFKNHQLFFKSDVSSSNIRAQVIQPPQSAALSQRAAEKEEAAVSCDAAVAFEGEIGAAGSCDAAVEKEKSEGEGAMLCLGLREMSSRREMMQCVSQELVLIFVQNDPV